MKSLLSIGLIAGLLANGSALAQSLADETATGELAVTSAAQASSSPYIKRSWVGTEEQRARSGYKSAIYPFAKWASRDNRIETTGGLPPPAQAVDGRSLAVTLALNALLDAAGTKDYFVKR